MWTALALLAASVIGTVVGAIATNSAQRKANEANIQMQKEANETNIALQESANEANKSMQESANATNIRLAQDEMAFNSAEAQKQRDFELMMSNTAVSRRMDDLASRGVNPLLAIGDPAQMASGYAASASSARVNSPVNRAAQVDAAHVQPVNGLGEGMSHMASIMQSAAFMMALRANSADRLQGTQQIAEARKYSADRSFDARTASMTDFYRDRDGAWRAFRSRIYK